MSGGHFYPEYSYHQVSGFAAEVEAAIATNGLECEDKYMDGFYPNHPPEVIEYIKSQIPQMYKISEIMRHIDYLYAGDHGSDSFMKLVKEVEEKYGNV